MTSPQMSDPLPPLPVPDVPTPEVSSAPGVTSPPTAETSPPLNPPNPAPPAVPSTFDMEGYKGTTNFISGVPASGLPADMKAPPGPPSFLPGPSPDMPTPETWEVTRDQTVAGQFASIMDSGNPAFQVVQEQIMRAHAAQGGQNSLMAARSAAMAMADVGFRIASQDAATFARSAEFNAAMSNQFGLAEQQFMHNAMLSEQNFRQGVLMLREQHMANLDQISADLASRMQLMGLEANINLQLEAKRQENVLAQIDANFRNSMGTMQAQFEYNWDTAEQAQSQALERMDRETTNELYRGTANFGWQRQLNYLSEQAQNSRMLLSAMGEIGGNPNITAAQASSAMQDVLRQYNAVNAQLAATYSAPTAQPQTIATSYLDFSTHRVGYENTQQPQPAIPFYGGPPAPVPPPPGPPGPAPGTPGPPMSDPTPPSQEAPSIQLGGPGWAEAYLAANPDVAATRYATNPMEHWTNYGQYEGRTWGQGTGGTPPAPTGQSVPVGSTGWAAAYLAANPDVAADPAFKANPMDHWLRHGQYETNPPRTW